MDEQRRGYLHLMGIETWELRHPERLAAAPSLAAAPPEPAGTPAAPEPVEPDPMGLPEPESRSSPESETQALPEPVEPDRVEPDRVEPDPVDPSRPSFEPALTDVPDEYDQWAALTEQDPDDFSDFHDPEAPSPVDRRAERIATLDWDELRAEVAACTACPLHASRRNPVFGVGDQQARWMFIGEAPGADEDRLGEPFVGKAGKLLDHMLQALGLDRSQVYIANILKSRPPNNRDPQPEEAQACWPYLLRQIQLVRPGIIVAVGRIATNRLLDSDLAMGQLRGRVHRFGPAGIPLVATYHPAYLLRSPREKRKSWEDLQLARRTLESVSP